MEKKDSIFKEIREIIEEIPVIDCHEHTKGPDFAPEYKEPIASLIQGYFQSDLISAGATEEEMALLNDQNVSTEKKWPVFEKLWKKTQFTGYAKVSKIILEKIYGEKEMTLETLKRIGKKLINLRDEKTYYGIIEKSKIKCRLTNVLYTHTTVTSEIKSFLEGTYKPAKYDKLLIPLIMFHIPVRKREEIEKIGKMVNKEINSLEDYLEVCFEIFKLMKEKGAVGMKDQSAYERIIYYENVSKYEAEKLFNFILENPKNFLGWPEAKPLDDFLFHSFMKMAEELQLPVQIHTGHLAGIRGEIRRTNAVHLTNIFEIYRNVKFDIFHGNWPYMGELLFLLKNYPNVSVDLCWVHIIDPYYTRRFIYEAIKTVPHSKIHGFGGDYFDCSEYTLAHLEIAKENIAYALSELVRENWISVEESKEIAFDLLFNNPNTFFNLKLK